MIDEVEMKQSDSKSKFVRGHGRRLTFSIRNSKMADPSIERKSYNLRKRKRPFVLFDDTALSFQSQNKLKQ